MSEDPELINLESAIDAHRGIENHPHGFLLVRMAHVVRRLVVSARALNERVAALEDAAAKPRGSSEPGNAPDKRP